MRQSIELSPEYTDLSNLWFSTSFLLKRPPARRTIEQFGPAVELSLKFLDSLAPLAERCGLADAGAMIAAIMPQKEALSARQGSAASAGASRENLISMGLGEEEVDDLITAGSMLRSMVRMKIADKNDIGTARFALMELQHFFESLAKHAEKEGTDQFSVFLRLQH